jgi:rRNA-processing protein EBP2
MAHKNKDKKSKVKAKDNHKEESKQRAEDTSMDVDIAETSNTNREVKESLDEEEGISDSGSEDLEGDGVGEEGLEKVMQLLGEDGLDEEGQMQLGMLNGDGDDDDDDDGDWEDGNGDLEDDSQASEDGDEDSDLANSEDEEDEDEDEDEETSMKEKPTVPKKTDLRKGNELEEQNEEEEGIALDDLSEANLSLDADAVPRQKVTVDNQVSFCDQ